MSQKNGFSGRPTLRPVAVYAMFIRERWWEENLWEEEEESSMGQRERWSCSDLVTA